MKTSTSTFNPASERVRSGAVHTIDWAPDGAAVADLVLVHGYAEHSARYEPVARRLTAAGLRVASLDLPGHGRSAGPKGVVEDFEGLVDVVAQYVDEVHGDRPLFLYGHSMGGLAVVRLAERDDSAFAGMVIASAALAAAGSIPAPLVAMANVLGRLAPRLPTIVLDGTAISRDHDVRADYEHDPLNYRGRMSAGTGRQLSVAMAAAHSDAARITRPVLILHGEADRLTAPDGSERLFREVSSADKTLRTWPGAFHELHHEPERDEVLDVVVSWIDEHLRPTVPD
ncbi:MAG: alpha/beta hydrolase [Microthrixaceae bacterium]